MTLLTLVHGPLDNTEPVQPSQLAASETTDAYGPDSCDDIELALCVLSAADKLAATATWCLRQTTKRMKEKLK